MKNTPAGWPRLLLATAATTALGLYTLLHVLFSSIGLSTNGYFNWDAVSNIGYLWLLSLACVAVFRGIAGYRLISPWLGISLVIPAATIVLQIIGTVIEGGRLFMPA